MESHRYWVFITGGAGKTTYIGFSNDLVRRVWEHKNKVNRGFTAKYGLDRLVFYTEFRGAIEGIAYEKKLKGWSPAKK